MKGFRIVHLRASTPQAHPKHTPIPQDLQGDSLAAYAEFSEALQGCDWLQLKASLVSTSRAAFPDVHV